MKNIALLGQKDLYFIMGGQKYPVKLILKSHSVKGAHGEDLYHVIAKHTQHDILFRADCISDEIEIVEETASS